MITTFKIIITTLANLVQIGQTLNSTELLSINEHFQFQSECQFSFILLIDMANGTGKKTQLN